MTHPLWQAKSFVDFTRLEQKRPEQATVQDGVFRAEVRFGDQVPGYSDARTLWDVSQHLFHEGDEVWTGFSVALPSDWIGWFPKNDELGNWPGSRDTLKGGQHGGSVFEFHHGPEDGNWNDPKLGGSAPLYVVATDRDIKLYLVDPAVGPRPDALWTLVPNFERERAYDLVIGTLWSADPKKGWVEVYTDDKQVVPRFPTSTLYPPPRPPTFVYGQFGLYRRGFIGDPSLKWGPNAPLNRAFDGQLAAPGKRVFSRDDGYPQSVQLKGMRMGAAKEDVMQPSDVVKPDPPVPDPVTPPVPPSPAKPSVDPEAGAALLMATVEQLDEIIAGAAKVRDQAQALLNKGPYKPAG